MQHISGGEEETYYQISSHFSESLPSITFSTFKRYRFPLNYPLSTKIDLAGDFCFGNKNHSVVFLLYLRLAGGHNLCVSS